MKKFYDFTQEQIREIEDFYEASKLKDKSKNYDDSLLDTANKFGLRVDELMNILSCSETKNTREFSKILKPVCKEKSAPNYIQKTHLKNFCKWIISHHE